MSRIGTAFRAFFSSLFNRDAAERVAAALRPVTAPVAIAAPVVKSSDEKAKPEKPRPEKPKQSEAITLLATLQREARLIDFLMEEIAGYEDAQIGAVVREIHRDARKVLDRLCPIQPIVSAEEGSPCDVPAGSEDGRYRMTGKVGGSPPFHGVLRHHGWEAAKCDLPAWTGPASATLVLAPAEVEIA